MITVSEKALDRITKLFEENKYDDTYGLRVSVVSGGCSGLSYKIDFDNKSTELDQILEDKGLKILIDKKSVFYLIGTELDFSEGLNGKGFYFKNPNASRTCGCGESFSL